MAKTFHTAIVAVRQWYLAACVISLGIGHRRRCHHRTLLRFDFTRSIERYRLFYGVWLKCGSNTKCPCELWMEIRVQSRGKGMKASYKKVCAVVTLHPLTRSNSLGKSLRKIHVAVSPRLQPSATILFLIVNYGHTHACPRRILVQIHESQTYY